jgi:hypothetical protein
MATRASCFAVGVDAERRCPSIAYHAPAVISATTATATIAIPAL